MFDLCQYLILNIAVCRNTQCMVFITWFSSLSSDVLFQVSNALRIT